MYANSLRVAMNKQGITSMKTAAKTIGKNTRTAQDIINNANGERQWPLNYQHYLMQKTL